MTANGTTANGAAQNGSHSLHDEHDVVLVLDYGSQYTQLICRRIREVGVFSMMFPGDADMVGATAADPKAETAAAGSSSSSSSKPLLTGTEHASLLFCRSVYACRVYMTCACVKAVQLSTHPCISGLLSCRPGPRQP